MQQIGQLELPILGGILYPQPPFALTLATALSGPTGAGGVGTAAFDLMVPALPGLVEVPVFSQAVVVDAGAVFGYSFSRGLELRFE